MTNRTIAELAQAAQKRDWSKVHELSGQLAAESPGSQNGFTVCTSEALFAPIPEPTYVITDVMREASLLYWAAYGSSSKTWQGLDAAVSVALGQPWLHRFPTVKGRTAIVDYESGEYELRRRLQLIARARGAEAVDDIEAAIMPGLYMGTPAFLAAMERLADGRSLVVLDSLRAAALEDENDSRIRKGLDDLRKVAEKTRCAFGVLVHAKKTSSSVVSIDDREILRGSSAIYDAADVVLASFYQEADQSFNVRQCKARQGRAAAPFRVRLEDVPGGVLVKGEDMPKEADVEEKAKQDIRMAIHGFVSANPRCTRGEIENAVKGYRGETKRAALDAMVRECVLSEERQGSARHYWVVGTV